MFSFNSKGFEKCFRRGNFGSARTTGAGKAQKVCHFVKMDYSWVFALWRSLSFFFVEIMYLRWSFVLLFYLLQTIIQIFFCSIFSVLPTFSALFCHLSMEDWMAVITFEVFYWHKWCYIQRSCIKRNISNE